MAMKRLPASVRADSLLHALEEILLENFGSSVVPDLLETMNRVFARSILFSNALTCAGIGGIEHVQFGKAGNLAESHRSTSGQRLEPPMPSSRMSVKFSFLTSATAARSLSP